MLVAQTSLSSKKSILSVLTIAITLASFLAMSDANACAACGSSLSNDWETQGISSKSGFIADLSYSYLNQNNQWYGSSAPSNAFINSQFAKGQEVETYTKTQTVTASLIYNDNDNAWGVALTLPYLMRDHGTFGSGDPVSNPTLGSNYTTSSDSGIGDIKVLGRYSGFSAEQTWGIITGLKFPTGNIGTNFNAGTNAGTPLDAGLQIGTGSTDIIYGAYTTGNIEKYGWFLQGTVQRAFATQPVGGLDYRPGDTYSINSGIRYAGFGAKVSPMLQLNIIKRLQDTGIPDPISGLSSVPTDPVSGASVSGGTLAYIAPGATVRVGGGTSLYGFIQIPVYQNVSSLQLTPGYTVTMGMRQSLD